MSDPISASLSAMKTQTEHESCRVSIKGESWTSEASIFLQKKQNYFVLLQCQMSCSADYIDNEYKAMMALITEGVFEPMSVFSPQKVLSLQLKRKIKNIFIFIPSASAVSIFVGCLVE